MQTVKIHSTASANAHVSAPRAGGRNDASKVQCRAMKPMFNQGSVEDMKKMALAAGAAVLLMGEPSAAWAKTVAAPTQGQLLDQLLEQQKSGQVKAKIIKAKSAPTEKAVYGQQKKTVVKKATDTKKTKASAAKSASSKKADTFKATSAPLKFSSKAATGTQGSAPAGIALPVPKGAVSAPKPKAAAPKPKAAAPKPKAAAPKPKTAAPKPKADNPLARKKAAAAAGAAAVVAEKAVEKVAPAAPAPAVQAPAVKNYVKNTPAPKKAASPAVSAPSLGGDATEAGIVAASEILGLVIASSVVDAVLKPTKPAAAKRG